MNFYSTVDAWHPKCVVFVFIFRMYFIRRIWDYENAYCLFTCSADARSATGMIFYVNLYQGQGIVGNFSLHTFNHTRLKVVLFFVLTCWFNIASLPGYLNFKRVAPSIERNFYKFVANNRIILWITTWSYC